MDEKKEMMIQDELLNEMRMLKKTLFVNRVIGIVSCVMSLAVIVIMLIGISKLNAFTREVQIVTDKVSQVDMEQINSAIENFNDTVNKLDFEYINESFKEVDMKAIGEIVETIDAAELEETLENINDVSEKLKNLSEKITNLFSFGR
nr:hypothetical protein [Lachnospiraceae bacterium]